MLAVVVQEHILQVLLTMELVVLVLVVEDLLVLQHQLKDKMELVLAAAAVDLAQAALEVDMVLSLLDMARLQRNEQ
jgi:hypothetical protein